MKPHCPMKILEGFHKRGRAYLMELGFGSFWIVLDHNTVTKKEERKSIVCLPDHTFLLNELNALNKN